MQKTKTYKIIGIFELALVKQDRKYELQAGQSCYMSSYLYSEYVSVYLYVQYCRFGAG